MVAWWWLLVTAVLAGSAGMVLAAVFVGGGSGHGPPMPRPSPPKRFAGQRDLMMTLEEDARGDEETKAVKAVRGGSVPQGGPGSSG